MPWSLIVFSHLRWDFVYQRPQHLMARMAAEHPVFFFEELARQRRNWQIVMVGPVVNIDPALLPRHTNVHYFGQRDYQELPDFIAGWDVCLLPFALNDATRFLSPTKTLEYMAAERPIDTTAIKDVVEPYGDIVFSATGRESFVRQCDLALRLPPATWRSYAEKMRDRVRRTSWDSTAAQMSALIEKTLVAKNGVDATLSYRSLNPEHVAPTAHAPGAPFADDDSEGKTAFGVDSNRPLRTIARSHRHEVIVIGAGPTGLSAAYHLGKDALLLERNATVGGWCRSVFENGYTFDHAGHIMFSNEPYVHELYARLLDDNVHWQDREAWIYSKNIYTRYPFQGALYGLPADVLKECIVGAIEARFGPLSASATTSSAVSVGTSPSSLKAESITDCCADGTLPDFSGGALQPRERCSSEPGNFEEFIFKVWGAGVAKHFAIPYNRKLWAVPLSEMETSWLGGRVPLPNLEEMIDGALRPAPKPVGPNARFGYPLRGGFQALMNGFLPLLEGSLRLNANVVRVDAARRELSLDDGTILPYRRLISTTPLPALVRMLGNQAPESIKAAASDLRYVSVRCINLGVRRRNLTDKHWVYYPDDTVFHRVFMQSNASPHCSPADGFGLTCEITYSSSKPLPCEGEALIDRCIEDCIRVGLFTRDDPLVVRQQLDMPCAYVVYDHARASNVARIREWLSTRAILPAGRYAEWEYYNSDHAFIAGRKAAEAITSESRRRDASVDALRGSRDQAI